MKSLVDYEKKISFLVTELCKVMKWFDEAGELTNKFRKVDETLSAIDNVVSDLVELQQSSKETSVKSYSSQVNAQCNQWEDFKTLCSSAKIVFYLSDEAENRFQANALLKDLTLTYSGDFPKEYSQDNMSLKTWLSTELNVLEEKIFEGSLLTQQNSLDLG